MKLICNYFLKTDSLLKKTLSTKKVSFSNLVITSIYDKDDPIEMNPADCIQIIRKEPLKLNEDQHNTQKCESYICICNIS